MQIFQKHLVKCRCVLPQFKALPDPPPHQFIVSSIINDDGQLNPKLAQCNNCGIIHKVIDVCRSEILDNREESTIIISIDDIKKSLPEGIAAVLETHDASLPAWEHAQFIIDNQRWGEFVILTSELIDGQRHGKYVRILGASIFKVESYVNDELVTA